MLDGSPAARRLLNAASDGARSEAERLLIKLLRDHGITGWKANLPVGGYKVDVTSPAQKVAIENRRLGVSQWPRRLRKRPQAAEHHFDAWLADTTVHMAGLTEYPDRVIAGIKLAIDWR